MAVVNFLSHVPLLRMEPDRITLGPGQLWRMPFESWNGLTARAFEDHRDRYEATAPVFYFMEIEVDWPILVAGTLQGSHNLEMKSPTVEPTVAGEAPLIEQVGLGFMQRFLEAIAPIAQASITLAAPAAAPLSLRSSMTFCTADDHYFTIDDIDCQVVRIQGDGDHEWLLFAEAPGVPLTQADIEFADHIWPFAAAGLQSDELRGMIESLLDVADATLDDNERMMLATVALEALLLPDVHTHGQDTLARRSVALLGDYYGAERVQAAARAIYRARNALVHGADPIDDALTSSLRTGCAAQQLLAASLLAVGPAVLDGVGLDALREGLEAGRAPVDAIAPRPFEIDEPRGRYVPILGPEKPTSVVATGGTMKVKAGDVLSWSPLVGLGVAEPVDVGDHFVVMPIDAQDLGELEEMDISRDFMQGIVSREQLGTLDVGPTGGLALRGRASEGLEDFPERRRRAVTALRLCGFEHFVDPSLLGWFVYHGAQRTRIPTVLRQTVYMKYVHEREQRLATSDGTSVATAFDLLVEYEQHHRHEGLDRIIDAYLRSHHEAFLPPVARARLQIATLEASLGRFRPVSETLQLEHLVRALVGDTPAATWFDSSGRDFRNDVAHGRWNDLDAAEPTRHLLTILRATVGSLIEHWVADDHGGDEPSGVLLRALTSV